MNEYYLVTNVDNEKERYLTESPRDAICYIMSRYFDPEDYEGPDIDEMAKDLWIYGEFNEIDGYRVKAVPKDSV